MRGIPLFLFFVIHEIQLRSISSVANQLGGLRTLVDDRVGCSGTTESILGKSMSLRLRSFSSLCKKIPHNT